MAKRFRLTILFVLFLALSACVKEIEPRPEPGRETGREGASLRASFYGPNFHGRITASGEIFDQNAMTAAHRSYPFGTRLAVRNPKNGKEIVVRINDRGPRIKGRELDLSLAAARALDMEEEGVAWLEVRRLDRPDPASIPLRPAGSERSSPAPESL